METNIGDRSTVVGPFKAQGMKVVTLAGYLVAEVLLRQGDFQIWRMALEVGEFRLVRIATRNSVGEFGVEEVKRTRGKMPDLP